VEAHRGPWLSAVILPARRPFRERSCNCGAKDRNAEGVELISREGSRTRPRNLLDFRHCALRVLIKIFHFNRICIVAGIKSGGDSGSLRLFLKVLPDTHAARHLLAREGTNDKWYSRDNERNACDENIVQRMREEPVCSWQEPWPYLLARGGLQGTSKHRTVRIVLLMFRFLIGRMSVSRRRRFRYADVSEYRRKIRIECPEGRNSQNAPVAPAVCTYKVRLSKIKWSPLASISDLRARSRAGRNGSDFSIAPLMYGTRPSATYASYT
jgi:hypothetical protein